MRKQYNLQTADRDVAMWLDWAFSLEAPSGGFAAQNTLDQTGSALPLETLELCRGADAVLLGAVGGPKWDDPQAKVRPEQGLLAIRKGLGLYANLRPVKVNPKLVADRLGDRVRRIVFMSAGSPGRGVHQRHQAPARGRRGTGPGPLAARQHGAHGPGQMAVGVHAGRDTQATLGDHPETRTQPVRLVRPADRPACPGFFGLDLPASYILLRNDLAAPRERFELMAARLSNPWIVESDGGNQAIQTRPKAVADALFAATQDEPPHGSA